MAQSRNKDEAFRIAREMSLEYQDGMVCVMDDPRRAAFPQVVMDENLHRHLVRLGWNHLAYFKKGERVR